MDGLLRRQKATKENGECARNVIPNSADLTKCSMPFRQYRQTMQAEALLSRPEVDVDGQREGEERNVFFATNETRGSAMLSYLKRGWEREEHKGEI